MIDEKIQRKLDALPKSPGVYTFLGEGGAVLYVGKARELRSRVRSYFQPGNTDTRSFIHLLERELADLETFVVGTAKEAALLENELIKRKQPRYNVKLKDDKDYLSLRLDVRERWPRLRVVRRPRPDGARYFGPYDSATSARRTLRLVNRHFRLRTCRDSELRSRTRPCLQYQIKRCPAPCVKEVPREEYLAQAQMVGMFLGGRHDELVDDLKGRMKEAAADLQYERAAVYRDQLRAVERVREKQSVAVVKDVDQEVFGLHRDGEKAEVAQISVRSGKMASVKSFALSGLHLPDDELLSSFLGELFGREGIHLPDEILLPMEIEAGEGLEAMLSERRGKKVRLWIPKRGVRRRLVEMAQENAAHAYSEKARAEEDMDARLGELKRRLRLPTLPRRIECIDISHIGGEDTSAAIVCVTDGQLDRGRYRSFKVRTVRGGDDYGAMREVLGRRFRRAKQGDKGWELPDLLVVDGGKGQLGIAMEVLRELDLSELPLAALAKEKERKTGKVFDRVFLPGQKNAIPLKERGASRYFLAMARDEAHRASNALRKKQKKKSDLSSRLEELPGVGKKTTIKLLTALGSLSAVREASEEALREAGASERQARTIYEAFRPELREVGPARHEAEAEEEALEAAFAADLEVDLEPGVDTNSS